METFLLFFKKPVFDFFAMRFLLLTGMIVFTVSLSNSQTNTTTSATDPQTMNSGAEIANTVILQTNNTIICYPDEYKQIFDKPNK